MNKKKWRYICVLFIIMSVSLILSLRTMNAYAESNPSGWDSNWNSIYHPVVWGYTTEE